MLMILTFVGIAFGELNVTCSGLVRLEFESFKDNGDYFIGYGATYFQSLRHAIGNESVLDTNSTFFKNRGVNFIRALGMVTHTNTSILPSDRWIELNESSYWQGLRDLLDEVWVRGIRVQLTIFTSTKYFDDMDRGI